MMFPWRAILSIITTAFLLAFFATIIEYREAASHPKSILKDPSRDATPGFFGARPPVALDQIRYDSGLHRRDICNDSFPGRFSETCAPSSTLCCIIPGASRPACVNILGFGFCCTEGGDCFVDTSSACGGTDSQQCAPGICCPAQTNCVDNFNYSTTDLVRCNVNRDLIPGGFSPSSSLDTARRTALTTISASDLASSTTTSASSSYPITSPATTATVSTEPIPAVPLSTDKAAGSNGLSAGAIAGIVIGSVAAVAIWAVAGLMLYNRCQRSKEDSAAMNSASFIQYYQNPLELPVTQQAHEVYTKESYAHAEVPNSERRQELP